MVDVAPVSVATRRTRFTLNSATKRKRPSGETPMPTASWKAALVPMPSAHAETAPPATVVTIPSGNETARTLGAPTEAEAEARSVT